MSPATPRPPAGDAPQPAEPAVIERLRQAEMDVKAALEQWGTAIRARDRLINDAYFEEGLRPYRIAAASGISPGTVQSALKAERARRADAAADAGTGTGPA